MIHSIKKILQRLNEIIKIIYYYMDDSIRYYFSAMYPYSSKFKYNEGAIIKLTHSIEKRISFGEANKTHGKTKAYKLLNLLKQLKDKVELQNTYPYEWALCTLFQFANQFLSDDEKPNFINQLITLNHKIENNFCNGGSFTKHRSEIYKASQDKFDIFSKSRHSIRNFEKAADIRIIENAVNLAQKCPSTCSIQPIKSYLIQSKEKVKETLSLQQGNRGFTEKIPQLFVITANLQLYAGVRERNQSYVDGGIFALSLTYALHFYGIGSCILNWSSSKKEDIRLRKLLEIPNYEVIILVMAIGIVPELNNIPVSKRRPVNSIFKIM